MSRRKEGGGHGASEPSVPIVYCETLKERGKGGRGRGIRPRPDCKFTWGRKERRQSLSFTARHFSCRWEKEKKKEKGKGEREEKTFV